MSELMLFRTGNTQFIQSLYDSCFKGISVWVKKNSGTQKEAEDVFQDAMTAVYQKSQDEDFTLTCKLSTFVFGVAKNMWLDRLRKKGKYVVADNEVMQVMSQSNQENIDQIAIDAEIDLVYRRNFEKLSEECKKLLNYFFNGLSMKEIIVKMNFSNDGIARKRKFNCKNELVKLVEVDPHYHELVYEN